MHFKPAGHMVFAALDAELLKFPISDSSSTLELREAAAKERTRWQEEFAAFVQRFEAAQPRSTDFGLTLDYGVALINLERTRDAIGVFEVLEKNHPGAYETAANLGTALELDGRLEEAAVWIAKGIERNPKSHYGTEWLHLAILRAKMRLREDAHWLETHSVLDGVSDRSAREIVSAIEYQLGERLQFVRPKDPVVCDLFFQAAVRLEKEDPTNQREQYLQLSLLFGDWRKAEVEKRLKS